MISVISIVCTAIMLVMVVRLVVKFYHLNRTERIEYVKSFKKGKCILINLVAVPLYLLAGLDAGKGTGEAILYSISKSIGLVVLSFEIPFKLIGQNIFYGIAIGLCFVLVLLNAWMFAFSVFHQTIWHFRKMSKFTHSRNDKCIIVGNNENSRLIYGSCHCDKMIVGSIGKAEQEQLYKFNVLYKDYGIEVRLWDWIGKEMKNLLSNCKKCGHKVTVILNNDTEQDNLDQCGRWLEFLVALPVEWLPVFDVYVFGDREFEDIYAQYEAKSRGSLHYINEYQQLAIDFIDCYPLTEFMDGKQIDTDSSLLHPETEVHVAMIGFGRVNQQIFLSMVANNQFLTKNKEGKLVPKNVEYHLFDRQHTGNHKNLNHNYFRYRFLFSSKDFTEGDSYLPLPEIPSSEQYHHLDINDIQFYDDLKRSLSFSNCSVNYIIVSLGMDYASIDLTNKIVTKLKEWKLGHTYLFVRIKDKKTFEDAGIFLDSAFCHPFGANQDVVYDYSHIIQEKFSEMAILRNFVYDVEHDVQHTVVTEKELNISRLRWFTDKTTIDRESNVYCCLSLRNKLHLMGLDYRRIGDATGEELTEEEYLRIYAGDDLPDIVYNCDGTPKAIHYGLVFNDSRRKTMAIQEHQRWNAFMIMRGFIPAAKEEILNEVNREGQYTNGKNYAMRHHGNLTTFDGLAEFRQMISKRDTLPEESCDVIKYDYQLLDGAWWLLHQSGFAIVKRKED